MDTFQRFYTTGFPSPGESWRERALRLDDLLIVHPASTYFVRVRDRSMQGAGIFPGDLVIVDRALEATHGSIVLATVRGTWTMKRVLFDKEKIWLQSEHSRYPTFEVRPSMQFQIFGVVLCVIHGVSPSLTLEDLIERYAKQPHS